MMSLDEVLGDVLAVDGVLGAILVAYDGLIVATMGDAGEHSDLESALFAASFATVERAISQLDLGRAKVIRIETSSRRLIVTDIGELLLVTIAELRSEERTIIWEVSRAARLIAQITSRAERIPLPAREVVGGQTGAEQDQPGLQVETLSSRSEPATQPLGPSRRLGARLNAPSPLVQSRPGRV